MRGVGHGGADDKEFAVSPYHYSMCAQCGKNFREGEGPRFPTDSLLPYHEHCLPKPDND